MDFFKKLQDEIEKYNKLLQDEHELEKNLATHKEERTVQFGKVQAFQALYEEHLADESKNYSLNGSGDTENIIEVTEKENAT